MPAEKRSTTDDATPEPGPPQQEQPPAAPAAPAPAEKHFIYKLDPTTNQVLGIDELDPTTGERKEVTGMYYGSEYSPAAGSYSYDPYGYYGYSAGAAQAS